MRTTRMTERISFISYQEKIVNGMQTEAEKVTHFSVWAEVPKVSAKEFNDPQTKIGYRRDMPVFYIRFLTESEIDMSWRIEWRGNEYQIVDFDPDYDKKDMTKIGTKRFSDGY